MRRPVQLTFRNMAGSPALEQEIRARAAWLETFYSDLVGCRVLVEIRHRHRGRGRLVHVRIELSLPGEDVIVSHEPTLQATIKDLQVDLLTRARTWRAPTRTHSSRSTTPSTSQDAASKTSHGGNEVM